MRARFLAVSCVLVVGLSAYLGATAQQESVKLKLLLVDAETGKSMAGLVRAFRKDSDEPLQLSGLMARSGATRWYIVPAGGKETTLPAGPLRLEALAGLETGLTEQALDLTRNAPSEIKLNLKFLFRPEQIRLAAANTHVHVFQMPVKQATDYLQQVPVADRLAIVFISYAEAAKPRPDIFPVGDLKQFEAAGVLVNNGEEHRNNLPSGRYGHVMLLNLKELVTPVSIGPVLKGPGHFDEPSLSVGIDNTRRQGGTVIWCHNGGGYEYLPNVITGRVDALNCGDATGAGPGGDYYRMLNAGLRIPLSSGTDWGIYDFNRVYAKVDGPLSVPRWLSALKAGRSVISNGPLLQLTVDGRDVGEVLNLAKPRKVRVEASSLGRHDFQTLQLVHNGKVVASELARNRDGAWAARLQCEISIDQPGWFAAKIETQTKNEFGYRLFAHTSPVYVELDGKRLVEVEAARQLLGSLERSRTDIAKQAQFSTAKAKDQVLALYEQATQELTKRVNERPR